MAAQETRQRILDAATTLLTEQGRDAVTTRAVSAAAGVQPPTIYRLFTDMGGLLDAVAADGFAAYLSSKRAQELTDDPVEDLRAGWNLHQQFGLENPAHYLLMYAQPAPGKRTAAAASATERLTFLVERIAKAGQLTVPVDAAVHMVHSAGMGTLLSRIGEAPESRDPEWPIRVREAVISAITGVEPQAHSSLAQRAIALKAALNSETPLTAAEQGLLREYLDRLART